MHEVKYGFFESFPAGVKLAGKRLQSYIDQFRLILSLKQVLTKG